MADEKTKVVTDTAGPDAGQTPTQPEAGGGAPAPKQEQPAPEAVSPDKAPAPEQTAPVQAEKGADAPKEQKAASVSVFNFSEIMAGKKAVEKAAAQQEAKAPDKAAPASQSKETGQKREKPKEQEQPPKRRGRPPKEDKARSAAPAKKESPAKKDITAQKSAPAKKAVKAPKAPKPAKGTPEVKAPAQPETPAAPAEAPRPAKDEQIVYIKLSDLHAFKNHPFQVRNDEEMKAMVSSVRDKGVTQPAIVRPREDGGYEIVSGHRRQKASELAGFTDMPCIVRNLTDEQAITQMVEDNTNQRENILPSERAKALKMQLEAIKHQGAKLARGRKGGNHIESNQGYEILKSVTFDNGRGFALGYDGAAPSPFVTWQFTETESGQRDYYWGHYHGSSQTAEKDFAKRIDDYKELFRVQERTESREPAAYYRYYSTQRPVDIGTFPKPLGNAPVEIINFDERRMVEGGTMRAWGELAYLKPLTEKQMDDYELRPAPSNPDRAARPSITAQLKEAAHRTEPKKEPDKAKHNKSHEDR